MAEKVEDEAFLDATGLACPLPVLKARKRLLAMPPGAVLRIAATDPMSAIDMPHFCRESGHDFLGGEEKDGLYLYRVRRGEPVSDDAT